MRFGDWIIVNSLLCDLDLSKNYIDFILSLHVVLYFKLSIKCDL